MGYEIEVERDGRWWMVKVPALRGYVAADGTVHVGDTTQARHRSEVEQMAREYISLVTGAPIDDVAVILPAAFSEKSRTSL
jgi:hypothetical protein